ncbi:sulfate adenylyltransferase subunit CysD [Nannocystis sp. ILAH1]|uniref:sulfate adenylyltransferase subunit CysD n=1 Tax=unclassified Nannocystis TaxID=2627009 RepID=UPI0022705F6C|nr:MULTISPECIES: sulfate adenylyltransferase subunit CysD [unclassified Nannocystis]MCY0992797.1 sulfate adenylyltransferase subunit CysD [Nannocystis sp. ILAH1]MCY1069972.1 sulfate adenylyltransferase subunit CysD [Nannocystis sp. RBIL2]
MSQTLTHLRQLEAESIHIIREVAAEFERPVLLFSGGKDSACMLHVARKAFHPAPLPFPLLHINTTWDFRELLEYRDWFAATHGMNLIVYTNEQALAEGINPFDTPTPKYSAAMQTQALVQALRQGGYDAAFGGARRDEEKARAKERVYSFRNKQMQWDPKNQRPELWDTYNGKVNPGESIRVFPLSNWTELDVWLYIHLEQIPLTPLYFATDRPCIERNGALIAVDDDRMRLLPGEVPQLRKVRFRTLGCYPLTGAIESPATTVPEIIEEMLVATHSERQGRLIDHDEAGSMEQKKKEGYF